MMNWRDYIHSDAAILGGKPIIKGTRISVEIILERFGYGWTVEQIMESYPHLTPEAIRACILFAAASVKLKSSYKLAA